MIPEDVPILDLAAQVTAAVGDPGLTMQLLLLCNEVLHVTWGVLCQQPPSAVQVSVMQHLEQAQAAIRQAMQWRCLLKSSETAAETPVLEAP